MDILWSKGKKIAHVEMDYSWQDWKQGEQLGAMRVVQVRHKGVQKVWTQNNVFWRWH